MAIENNDLLVVQKNGGGELRKATVSDLLAQGDALWKEDGNAVTPKKANADLEIEGDATIGKILLDGQVGSGTFTSGIYMYRSGTASATRINIGNSDTNAIWQNDGNFVINYDGSATFGNDPTTTASNGIKLAGSTGVISARRTADPTNYLFAGYSTVSGNTPVAYISADGSASFAGQASAVSSHATYSFVTTETTSNTGVFIGSSSQTNATANNSNIHLSGDGSAAFKGTIVVGDNTNGYTAPGVYLAKEGYVAVSNSTGGTAIWQGFNGTSTETSSINADGSANFAEHLDIGSSTATNAYVRVERSNAGNVFSGNGASGNTSYITDEGKANFKTVITGGNPSGGSNNGVANSFEGYVQATAPAGATIWYGYTQGSNTITSRIYADGSAEFKNFKLETLNPLPA